jgi:hypothetical protein
MDEKLEEDRRKKTSIAKRLIIFVVFGNFTLEKIVF